MNDITNSNNISRVLLSNVASRWTRRDIVVLKFGGTTMGATREEGRIQVARDTISQLVGEGKSVVPVFSAFRRGRSQSAQKVSVTDILQNFQQRILDAEDFESEVAAFHSQLRDIHFTLIDDLFLSGDQQLVDDITEDLTLIKATAIMCCKAYENVPSLNDYILTAGERLAVKILAAFLTKLHSEGTFPMPCKPVTALELGIYTDDRFGSANIVWDQAIENAREVILGKYLEQGVMPIVSGFDGIYDPENEFRKIMATNAGTKVERQQRKVYRTSLGRGGSDLTATFLGLALDAEYVGFCKETPGVLTADDAMIGDRARTIHSLTYDLATEAGNIYSRAVEPVRAGGVPVHIFDPTRPLERTVISNATIPEGVYIVARPLETVNVHVGSIPDEPGELSRFLDVFADNRVNVEEVYHQRSGTDCIVTGAQEDIQKSIEHFSLAGLSPISQFTWYFRAIGIITEELSAQFNQFMSRFEPLSLSTFQVGSHALTSTVARNRAGSPEDEINRVENIVIELHDELVCVGEGAAV